MSYSITHDNKITDDGAEVGYIESGTAYMIELPRGRGIASFRKLAGMPHLKFAVFSGALLPQGKLEKPTIEPAPVAPSLPEPPNDPHLGDKNPVWQRWFVAVHGEDAFKSRWPHRQLPQ